MKTEMIINEEDQHIWPLEVQHYFSTLVSAKMALYASVYASYTFLLDQQNLDSAVKLCCYLKLTVQVFSASEFYIYTSWAKMWLAMANHILT